MLRKSIDESSEPLVGRLGLCKSGTAKISRINRDAAKSGCACEWGGWGQLSEDGPGQHNPDRSEGPWGRAETARAEVPASPSSLTLSREIRWRSEGTKDDGKPECGEGLV